jgi:SecD/SecF fusion protein
MDADGKIGDSESLKASLLNERGEILKSEIELGKSYEADSIIALGSDLPQISLSEGEVASGTTFHFSYIVTYMNLGLDLVGGSEIEYRIPMESFENGEEKYVDLNEIVAIFNRKLNNSGLKEIFVQPVGQDRILIQLPGLKKSEVEQIKNTIERQGNLEFKIAENDEKLIQQARDYIERGKTLPLPSFPYQFVYQTRKTTTGLTEKIPGTELLVSAKAKVSGKDIVNARKGLDNQSLRGGYSIHISFSAQGSNKFGDLTEESVGKRLAIILDGSLQSAPNVNEPILGGQCQITGSFSADEADSLVAVLRSGSMDVRPELLTENTVGPTLGSDSISSGLNACLIGGILVLGFMFSYYRGLGAVANLALVLNMVMLFGAMSMFGGTLTLPGIAGFALTIGMAVDATVLIFERMREESNKKQAIKATLAKSYQRAFVTIFDSNFTTFITALILYWVGNSGPVKGFCLSLMLGLAINLFAAVFVTQTIVSFLVYNNKMKSFAMANPIFKGGQINFFALSQKMKIVSIIVLVIGLGFIFSKGSSFLDVDFTGGNLLQVELTKASSVDDVRKVVNAAGYNSAIVQSFGEGNQSFTVRTPPLTQVEKQSFQQKLLAELPLPKDTSMAFPRDITVGGVAATEMLGYAVVALIVAMLVILMYIMIRFSEFKYGLGACLALVHDVGITLSLLAIFGIQINLTIFAAILTVVGYSLNDTIVIFDRIRENIGTQKNYDFQSIAIKSLNQTLNRTILTSVTTTFVVASLIIVGGGVIQGFATTMLFGVITGTYSSLFVAAPFVLFLHKKDKYAQMDKDNDQTPEMIKPSPEGTV